MAARKVLTQKTPVKKTKVRAAEVVEKFVPPMKKVTERTVRSLTGQTLLSLQSKKRMNSLFVVNMCRDHNIIIDIGGSSVMIPDTWMPYDLSTHAEPQTFLQAPSFRSLISSTTTRGPLLKVLDSRTATFILESAESEAERNRLKALQEEIKPSQAKAVKQTVSPQLKEFMNKLNSGDLKPRSAGAMLGNIVKNEAEKAYVLKNSTHPSVSAAARALRLNADGATVRGQVS